MARPLNLTRTEAEYLVDLLESQDDGMARELAADLRQLFGMAPADTESCIAAR